MRKALAVWALTCAAMACSDKAQPPTPFTYDAGADGGHAGAGGSGLGGSGLGGSGGSPQVDYNDCSMSGACALVSSQCTSTSGIHPVSTDRVAEYISTCAPIMQGETCTCKPWENTDWPPKYAWCSYGSICLTADLPPPPDSLVCPAEPPLAGQPCTKAARCEYSDDLRIDCRHVLDCAGAAPCEWVEVNPGCADISPCASGVVQDASCQVPKEVCSASSDSYCYCKEVTYQNNRWKCFPYKQPAGCPATPPRLGQACSPQKACCEYGPSGADLIGSISQIRSCEGSPPVWMEAWGCN